MLAKNETVTALKIIGNLPGLYQPVVAALNLSNKSTDLEEVETQVRKHYKQFIKDKKPEEMAMVNYTPVEDRNKRGQYKGRSGDGNKFGKFKGKCYNCNKMGHRKEDCWAEGGGSHNKKKENANAASDKAAVKDKAPCFLCDKQGHKAADCPNTKETKKKEFAGVCCVVINEDPDDEFSVDDDSLPPLLNREFDSDSSDDESEGTFEELWDDEDTNEVAFYSSTKKARELETDT